MRSLPDEIGAIAFAAKLVGYDWNYVLTHPEMYYGSGTIFFTYPLFCIVKDPLILYQCLLGVGAFLHALTAFIAGEILTKYYKEEFSSISIIIISAICAFITPTRTSNIDNEPMLVLICWIIVYLIMRLQHSVTKTQKILTDVLHTYKVIENDKKKIYVEWATSENTKYFIEDSLVFCFVDEISLAP